MFLMVFHKTGTKVYKYLYTLKIFCRLFTLPNKNSPYQHLQRKICVLVAVQNSIACKTPENKGVLTLFPLASGIGERPIIMDAER
jgi:hypothetical protein